MWGVCTAGTDIASCYCKSKLSTASTFAIACWCTLQPLVKSCSLQSASTLRSASTLWYAQSAQSEIHFAICTIWKPFRDLHNLRPLCDLHNLKSTLLSAQSENHFVICTICVHSVICTIWNPLCDLHNLPPLHNLKSTICDLYNLPTLCDLHNLQNTQLTAQSEIHSAICKIYLHSAICTICKLRVILECSATISWCNFKLNFFLLTNAISCSPYQAVSWHDINTSMTSIQYLTASLILISTIYYFYCYDLPLSPKLQCRNNCSELLKHDQATHANIQCNNYHMTKCTHVPRRPCL